MPWFAAAFLLWHGICYMYRAGVETPMSKKGVTHEESSGWAADCVGGGTVGNGTRILLVRAGERVLAWRGFALLLHANALLDVDGRSPVDVGVHVGLAAVVEGDPVHCRWLGWTCRLCCDMSARQWAWGVD